MSSDYVSSFIFLNLFQIFLEPSQPGAHVVNLRNLRYVTLRIFHLSDLESVLGKSLRITFCRKSPLQCTLEKMQMCLCKMLEIKVQSANVLSTCPYLGAISWHYRIGVGMGLRSKSGKDRCNAKFCGIWKFLDCLQWLALQLLFKQAHIPFLYLVAAIFCPDTQTLLSENKGCKQSLNARGPAWPHLPIALESSSTERCCGQLCIHLLFHLPLTLLKTTVPKADFSLIRDPSSTCRSGLNTATAASLVNGFFLGLKNPHSFCT